jgi:flagellar hook assembly protein FlgD
MLGEKVRRLVDAKQSAGVQQATWDGCDEHGQRVSSGVYLYRLKPETSR